MSTAYNRRRGAKANAARKPRECNRLDWSDVEESIGMPNRRCIRLADGASRYCADHRMRSASVEGPVGRKLRLWRQANQQRYADIVAGKNARMSTAMRLFSQRIERTKAAINAVSKWFGWDKAVPEKEPAEKAKKRNPWTR